MARMNGTPQAPPMAPMLSAMPAHRNLILASAARRDLSASWEATKTGTAETRFFPHVHRVSARVLRAWGMTSAATTAFNARAMAAGTTGDA
jgi:hypothetical protein